MYEIESCQVLRLVSLHVPDEVPPDRRSHGIHFIERFLNAVLSDVPESSLPRRLYRFGAMSLGHGHQRYALSMTPPLHGGVDATPDLPQSLRQVRKTHNVPSYRR